jgi:formamidopyrimidine-DNA glycosylase
MELRRCWDVMLSRAWTSATNGRANCRGILLTCYGSGCTKMPELPEAEYMVRRLAECAGEAVIDRVRVLRPSAVAPQKARHVCRTARGPISGYARRAKNVLIRLESEWTIRVRLGMTGHVYPIADARKTPRFARVSFDLAGGGAIVFEDARTLGGVSVHEKTELERILAQYGPEPLDPQFRWRDLQRRADGLSLPVKQFLLDPSRVAGLGNIWAAEALFRAGVHPEKRVRDLDAANWRRLHAAIRQTLTKAIENTFRVTKGPSEFPEADLLRLYVYGRAGEPCRKCGAAVTRTVQAGRGTYFCERCQA